MRVEALDSGQWLNCRHQCRRQHRRYGITTGEIVTVASAVTFTIEGTWRRLITVGRFGWTRLAFNANTRITDRIGAALFVVCARLFAKTVFTDASREAVCADLASILVLDTLTRAD